MAKDIKTVEEAEKIVADAKAEDEAKDESIDLADVKKQVAEMLAEAKAEAEKIAAGAKAEAEAIIADAKASVGSGASEEQKAADEKRKAYWDELVPVKLFRDNHKYKDDVFVAVNGENCVIQRGVEVMIKRKFKHVLDNSDLQDYETSKLIEKKSGEFAKSEL